MDSKKILEEARKIVGGNIILLISTFVAIFLLLYPEYTRRQITIFDVGQGDATMIEVNDLKILIDGGPGIEGYSDIDRHLGIGDRVVDVLILTHPHTDHLDGVIHVLENLRVGEIWYYPTCYDSKRYEELFKVADMRGVEAVPVTEIVSLTYVGVEVTVIPPSTTDGDGCQLFNNVNNASLVVRVKSDKGSALLMGDAEKELEKRLVDMQIDLDVDVLKAGHHCSDTSTTDVLLQETTPNIVVCSVGEDNDYGHPDDEVIGRLDSLGIEYILTYEYGDVVFEL